jgi:FixJ family two-component response regulator
VLPGIRIVIISGQMDVQRQAPANTDYDFLLKPFKIGELMEVLQPAAGQDNQE